MLAKAAVKERYAAAVIVELPSSALGGEVVRSGTDQGHNFLRPVNAIEREESRSLYEATLKHIGHVREVRRARLVKVDLGEVQPSDLDPCSRSSREPHRTGNSCPELGLHATLFDDLRMDLDAPQHLTIQKRSHSTLLRGTSCTDDGSVGDTIIMEIAGRADDVTVDGTFEIQGRVVTVTSLFGAYHAVIELGRILKAEDSYAPARKRRARRSQAENRAHRLRGSDKLNATRPEPLGSLSGGLTASDTDLCGPD